MHRPVKDAAADFLLGDLFFSRTDGRGVIQAGNEVFHDIAKYEWEELLGAPHKVIRHPHMPKAVFWPLWDTIKQGKPIGAYVKKSAKDGRYYWVYAIVTPVGEGYLSVRLKPTSELLPVVEAEYANLVRLEQENGIKPEESAALLLGRLQELGFQDYPSFMATALAAEMTARNTKLDRGADFRINHFRKLVENAQLFLKEARMVASSYNRNQFVAFNMRIQSARMERGGKLIGVISTDYNTLSMAISEQMDAFIESAQEVFAIINEGLFKQGTAKIQREVIEQFALEENLPESINKQDEMELLEQQQKRYETATKEGLLKIAEKTHEFSRSSHEMKRLIAGLEVTRVMGKIECSHVKEMARGLIEVLDDLEVFQEAISNNLKNIVGMNEAIDFHTQKLIDPMSVRVGV